MKCIIAISSQLLLTAVLAYSCNKKADESKQAAAPTEELAQDEEKASADDDSDDKKKSTSTETPPAPSTDVDPPSGSSGALAIAYPQDLVVSSPLSADSPDDIADSNAEFNSLATGALAIDPAGTLALISTREAPMEGQGPVGFAAKRLALAELLYGATTLAQCAYSATPPGGFNPGCYGPSLNYVNHPDSATPNSGQLPSGDLGIWTETNGTGGDACVAAQMNTLIDSVSQTVDNAVFMGAMLLCAYRVESGFTAKPGDEINLQPFYNKLVDASTGAALPSISGGFLTVTEEDGKSVYEWEYSYSQEQDVVLGGGGNVQVVREYSVNLRHKAESSDAAQYSGKLKIRRSTKDADTSQTCGSAPEQDTQQALSVQYKKASNTSMVYELRRGGWLASIPESQMFDASGSAKLPRGGVDCNNGGEFAVIAINPQEGTGDVAYAWIAGQGGENTRSFVASTEIDSQDKKQGCGFFGFGPSMDDLMDARDAANAGEQLSFIEKFICNWAAPGNDHNAAPSSVQKQCMQLDANSDPNLPPIWTPTLSKISYSPQNNCERGVGQATTFTLEKQGGGPLPGWETPTPPPETHELLPIVSSYGGGQDSSNAALESDLKSPPLLPVFNVD